MLYVKIKVKVVQEFKINVSKLIQVLAVKFQSETNTSICHIDTNDVNFVEDPHFIHYSIGNDLEPSPQEFSSLHKEESNFIKTTVVLCLEA